jgi:hypothetical protein
MGVWRAARAAEASEAVEAAAAVHRCKGLLECIQAIPAN